MGLTDLQLEVLSWLHEARSTPDTLCTGRRRTIMALVGRGMVTDWRYANGTFWETTDAGSVAYDTILKALGLNKDTNGSNSRRRKKVGG